MSKSILPMVLAFAVAVSATGVYADDDAVPETVTKTQLFVTDTDDEDAYAGYTAFDDSFEKEGYTYTLADVEYEVQSEKLLDTMEKIVETKDTPEAKRVIDGVTYDLAGTIEGSREVRGPYWQIVDASQAYGENVRKEEVPKTKTVRVRNDRTGKEQDVECKIEGLYLSGLEDVPTVVPVDITVRGYDADVYEWNGITVQRNGDEPPLVGHEAELLEKEGFGSGCTVAGITWNAEPYTDTNGVVCRNATAQVNVPGMSPTYEARYRGLISEPAERETFYTATYRAKDPDGDKNYTVRATAVYMRGGSRRLTTERVLGISVACVAALAALVLVLFVIKRKGHRQQPVVISSDDRRNY